jgi:hypothetical protein
MQSAVCGGQRAHGVRHWGGAQQGLSERHLPGASAGQAQVDGATLRLNGLGLCEAALLKVHVYVAALYVANVSSDPQALLGSNTPNRPQSRVAAILTLRASS